MTARTNPRQSPRKPSVNENNGYDDAALQYAETQADAPEHHTARKNRYGDPDGRRTAAYQRWEDENYGGGYKNSRGKPR